MNFVETTVSVELGGASYDLHFNANSMAAYEEATGKFFLDTVAQLYDVMRPALAAQKAASEGTGEEATPAVNAFDIIHRVPIKELRALIWAALHEYGRNPADPDEPSWPMTLNRVGRLIQLQDVPRVFTAFLRGQIKNSPSTEEMGESQARSVPAAQNGGGLASTGRAAAGGERSIELPADAFA